MRYNIVRNVALSVKQCMLFLEEQVNNNAELDFHTFTPFWPPFRFYKGKHQHEFILAAPLVRGLFRIKGSISPNGNDSVVSCKMSPPALFYASLPLIGTFIALMFYKGSYAIEVAVGFLIVSCLIIFINFRIAYRIFKELDKALGSTGDKINRL